MWNAFGFGIVFFKFSFVLPFMIFLFLLVLADAPFIFIFCLIGLVTLFFYLVSLLACDGLHLISELQVSSCVDK